jgi:photosystem II stability/assembly factor-like uncharacterized protein
VKVVRGALAVILFFALLIGGIPVASATEKIPPITIGEVLTNTSLGGYSQLGQIDMLSAKLGYALAVHPLDGERQYAYYLVRTTDLARTWTLQSPELYVENENPILADQYSPASDYALDFVNADIGYVAGPNGIIYVSVDAGRHWSQLATRGTYGVSSNSVSVVSSACTALGTANETCTNSLAEYALGAATPEHTASIPAARADTDVALLVAASGPTQVVNLSNDNDSAPYSLLETHNAGDTWRRLVNPCAGQMIEQLAVANDGEWLLSCFHDEGMFQGPAKVFSSINDGTTWQTVLNEKHGTTLYYFLSGNDHVIFEASNNPAGGLGFSENGGKTWSPYRSLGNDGGAGESISNFGPTSAIYQISQGPVYITRNDKTWTVVPPLPAGTYHDISVCTMATAAVRYQKVKIHGLEYEYINFENHSNSPCYLQGDPEMQPETRTGKSVGPVVASNLEDDADFVVLKAHGGMAHVVFQVNRGYPASDHCDPESARDVRIEFAPSSVFLLKPRKVIQGVCTTLPSIFTNMIQAGPGHSPDN